MSAKRANILIMPYGPIPSMIYDNVFLITLEDIMINKLKPTLNTKD